jgi:hypothetical protein
LKREVRSLLKAHEDAGNRFLNVGALHAAELMRGETAQATAAGRRIGPYLIEKEIGHAGWAKFSPPSVLTVNLISVWR